MLNHELMAGALAAQAPWWVPGTRHGYHANTFGFLVGELVRRLRGRTLGRFLAEEVTIPLGADVHIGLAPEHHGRVAEFAFPAVPPPEVEPDLAAADLMEFNAYWNPSGPVSYTHLDVYKRQMLKCPTGVAAKVPPS